MGKPKEREDEDQEVEPKDKEPAEPERGKEDDDEERAVDVRTRPDGVVEADVHPESRRERLARQRREEQDQAIERAVAPLREMNTNLTRMMQDLHGRLGQQPVAQPKPADAADDDEYIRLSTEMEDIIAQSRAEAAAGTLTPERAKTIKSKYYGLEKKRAAIVAKSELANFRPPQGPSFIDQQLQMAYPDVYAHQDANRLAIHYAESEIRERTARGKPPGQGERLEIAKASMKRAGEVYGILKATMPEPSAGERARFGGIPAHSRGGGGKVTRQLTDIDRQAAAAMFPDAPEKEQIEQFIRYAEANHYFDT